MRTGRRGSRVYDWALVATVGPRHHLLVRCGIADPTDLAYFYAYAPPGRSTVLAGLVAIAGIRRTVEEDFANRKDAVGPDPPRPAATAPGDAMSSLRWLPDQTAVTHPTIRKVWVDGGYHKYFAEHAATLGIDLEIVQRAPEQRGSPPSQNAGWWSELTAGSCSTAGSPATTKPFPNVPKP